MSSRGREAAFPRPYSEQQPGDRVEPQYAEAGMTMREWYAGMALSGLLVFWVRDRGSSPDPKQTARQAFAVADAMIAESVKKPD